ncbi:lytic transglycosylase domain-containing protein [Defluviimonas sp. WL0050]|uniref:Lytic transglycosylase domain-containing protein n=1 Tax=Albidovulum litorale TaxID=2984134 RepID=A0ABT2ZLU9_9RHOB|nr:lytic transglycosylase domain-containing protein [Defluviimonas sp. WL0050]MCV2872094.1 lytic transglycosylase domain-containing protein [Defluviimonas sp. WL0050]
MIRNALRAAPFALALLLPVMARADDPAGFRAALSAADQRDWATAVATARKAGPLAAAVIDWERLRDGNGAFGEYVDFLQRHPDWPGLPLLRQKGEGAITADTSADVIIGYFSALKPQTGMGSLALIAAYQARGQGQAAAEEAVRAWRTLSLTGAEHDLFVARHAAILKDHHDGRTATLLREGKVADARRMLPLNSAYTRALAEARIALQASDPGVDGLIAKLPETAVNSGGLAYDRFRWRIRKDLYDSADELLLERSVSAEALGDPDQWADWRRRLARKEMREGDARRAYRMAAEHHLRSGSDYADLEWLAGYIALRKLGDAKTALAHFDRFQRAVNGPISLSRAGYWRGRAYETLGMPGEAQAAYAEGARYPTAFYGLLSAEKVGLPLSPAMAGGETYPDWRSQPFAQSSVLLAARELMAAGDETLAARFLLHLGEGLSGYEIGALAGMAVEAKEPYVALSLAKAAAEKGVIWPSAYFPVPALSGLDLPVRPELALSIARRESEFNHRVISHAGARGLMQVMPGTAEMMAKKIGVSYEKAKLTTDWQYNARLGAAYLDQLVDEFGNSPLLVAVGYNAGPGRSRRWIAELGDPRAEGVDPIDWIEAIPFRETQTYVMRVAESLPIYRARLSGQTGPLDFMNELKGR